MNLLVFLEKYRTLLVGLIFVLIFLWENVIPQRRFTGLLKHNLQNIGYGIVNIVVTFLGGYYFSKYLDWFTNQKFSIHFQNTGWPSILILFLIMDLLMYWWHRFNHTLPFLWRFHAMHHRDTKMNSTTAVRFHMVELILSYVFRAFLYPLFGITSVALLIFSTVHFIMIIFHHSNVYINKRVDNFIRLFIASPQMHRIHHSNKWEETNSNYTSIFSCWDWVFRSYVHKPAEEITFGIPQDSPI